MNVIVTMPPYARFAAEVAAHPRVCGLRLNTVMPLVDPIEEVLERLASHGQPLWVDLKGRQLRVREPAIPPFTEIRLSHPLELETPCLAYFSDGREVARVAACRGDRLILEDGPRRLVGPGESINIPGSQLRVQGTLTDTDRAYLAAMRKLGLRDVMLSFCECEEDVREVQELLPEARVVLKIESAKGLDLASRVGASQGRLMAARGDLFVEVMPHQMPLALRQVVRADPDAIVASRFLTSLTHGCVQSSDISDLAFVQELGYRTIMLGDEVCLRGETVLEALEIVDAFAGQALACPEIAFCDRVAHCR